jgi:hypothetical protein
VDQPKGIEVVKEGIRKLKFNQQLRKAEGNKTPKVELTISIDGVAIQEPKTKVLLEFIQYSCNIVNHSDKGVIAYMPHRVGSRSVAPHTSALDDCAWSYSFPSHFIPK